MILRLTLWLLVIKAMTCAAFIYSGIGLMPEEAQYWTWSQDLSYGYYSKPAGIAYEIAFGTLSSMAVGLFLGPVMGYTVDTFRDFTGLKESERLPSILREQTPRNKKYAAALMTAASVAILAGIYSLNK